jgi:hypothetical protein
MVIVNQRKRYLHTLTHWAFILALLLGQTVALGHDHAADHDPDSVCALCLHSQQSGHALHSVITGLPLQSCHVFHPHTLTQDILASVIVPFHSRAPPFITC